MKKIIVGTVFAVVFVPAVSFALGELYNPLNVQITVDPLTQQTQDLQNQWQVDSLNQSLKNIQNAINNQTAQQAQLQQQQLIQQKQSQCPANTTVYVSKITGKVGGCICQPPYTMQSGACVMPGSETGTTDTGADARCKAAYGSSARSTGNGTCDLGIPATLQPKTNTTPAPAKSNNQICLDYYGSRSAWDGTLNAQSGPNCQCQSGYQWNANQTTCIAIPTQIAGVSGGAGGNISCDKMVMGQLTHLGTMTQEECYTTWQKEVETAQKTTILTNSKTDRVPAKTTTANFHIESNTVDVPLLEHATTTTTPKRKSL